MMSLHIKRTVTKTRYFNPVVLFCLYPKGIMPPSVLEKWELQRALSGKTQDELAILFFLVHEWRYCEGMLKLSKSTYPIKKATRMEDLLIGNIAGLAKSDSQKFGIII